MMGAYDRVYAAVNLDAVRSNMEAFREHVGGAKRLCAVVKTDGYGLGAVPVAKTVSDLVWGYATATIDEAVNLRRHGICQPVLVLGYVPRSDYEEMVLHGIRFTAFQYGELEVLSEVASRMGKPAYVHIKTDTGMGRIGLPPEEIPAFARRVRELPGLSLEGLYSHLATADMRERDAAWRQADRFGGLMRELEREGIEIPVCHLGNSAASMEMTRIPGSMFRIGISLYGYYPSEEMDKNAVRLIPAMELKTRIAFVKTVPAGTPIGYGAAYVTSRETVVATVPVGYGDGYPRSLSNRGEMLVCGRRAPVIGRVCMDQTMLDVTDIPGAVEGAVVTVVGKDGGEELTLEEVSGLAGSFNYEFLCDLGKRIPRVYYSRGRVVGTKDYFEDDYRFFQEPKF